MSVCVCICAFVCLSVRLGRDRRYSAGGQAALRNRVSRSSRDLLHGGEEMETVMADALVCLQQYSLTANNSYKFVVFYCIHVKFHKFISIWLIHCYHAVCRCSAQ